MKFRIYDRTGGGVTQDIDADSLDDAIEQGREWIENGEWGSGEDGTYRTITLDCEVCEITLRAPRPHLNGAEDSRVSDLTDLDTAPESIRGINYDEMDRCQLSDLVDYLEFDDGTVFGACRDLDLSIAEQIRDSLYEDDVEVEGDMHDCSGAHSDDLPECPVTDGPSEGTDSEGHEWVASYACCGGLRDNPGVWSTGGTGMLYSTVCARCGQIKTEREPGSQRNPGEALSTIAIEDATDKTRAWLVERHTDDDGWIPEWLAEHLDRPPTTRMTAEEAKAWVASHSDGDDLDDDDLEHAFAATFGRRADDQERADGLWSHLCGTFTAP